MGIADNPATGINIYPNPAKDKLYIEFNNEDLNIDAEVIIYNIQGQVMISKQIEAENSCIHLNNLNPGIYIIRTRYDQTLLTRKLIVH